MRISVQVEECLHDPQVYWDRETFRNTEMWEREMFKVYTRTQEDLRIQEK